MLVIKDEPVARMSLEMDFCPDGLTSSVHLFEQGFSIPTSPALILMAGYPGVGKTTLAYALKARLNEFGVNVKLLEKDAIEEEILKDLLRHDEQAQRVYARRDKDLAAWTRYEDQAAYDAYEQMFVLAAEWLQPGSGRSLIIDSSALLSFIQERALKLARQAELPLRVFLCEVDNRIRIQRLQDRPKMLSQRRGNLMTTIDEHHQNFNHLPSLLTSSLNMLDPLNACLNKTLVELKKLSFPHTDFCLQ